MSGSASPQRPGLGPRRGLLLLIVLAGGIAWAYLDLSLGDLWPSAERLRVAQVFFGAALEPALDYEAKGALPPDAPAFFTRLLEVVWSTLAFALSAWSLALLASIPLALFASTSFWSRADDRSARFVRTRRGLALQTATRALLVGLRSVHELLWAVLLLAALGLSPATAVIALALPFTGTLGKVISELLDESAQQDSGGLHGSGARPWQVFAFGVLPRALPDILSFSAYRLECSFRSSAVLGFFGFETLGYSIRLSFENLHYREVWTFLYTIMLLVILLEAWSGQLRRRFVA